MERENLAWVNGLALGLFTGIMYALSDKGIITSVLWAFAIIVFIVTLLVRNKSKSQKRGITK